MSYVELRCKTNFSFLRGASEASEYIEQAVRLGLPGIAITDVNGVYALPRAYEALKKHPHFKFISGCELTFYDHPSLTLLAQTKAGYSQMCRLITAAHEGKEKGKANLHFSEFFEHLEKFKTIELIAICSELKGANLVLLKEIFKTNLYLGISYFLDGLDEERNSFIIALSKEHGISLVAHNDVHYHVPERRKLQDALTCIREGTTLEKAGFKLFSNEQRYLKSPQEMGLLFKYFPEAIQNTLEIFKKCRFSLSELSYQYPSEWIPKGYTAQTFLEELVWNGADSRYKGVVPENVKKQIRYELAFTEKLQYADYFLTVYDIVKFAKDNHIYCQGRGSAANSIICYCLGITVIDPVKMDLLFERFISEERGEPPDIDVDFEHERREEVIQYIYSKYGRHRAAMVSAVRTYRRKSAFLEISKAFGVPVGTTSADALKDQFREVAGELSQHQNIIEDLVAELKGFPRHLSIHSCGFTLSGLPIIDTVPIEPARMDKRTICQWDKNDLDTLKLIKVDVLSLGFLTVIHKACNLIGIHFWDIPLHDDPLVYDLISKGNTIGTFQIESRAQISTLGITQPQSFYDLVVQVALVRPGPNVGEMKNPYIERRENAKRGVPFKFDDPMVEKILGRTFGVPIFQEQIMKLAVEKAGFSAGESDQLRRAIAAWRSSGSIDSMSKRFYDGLIAGGMKENLAKELFGYLKGFAEYGFPESHAASFAILSYISAWLKFYHPAELLCGLINSQPMGFYPIDVLINDFSRQGVKVLPIHPQYSEWDTTLVQTKTIQMGFRNVREIRLTDFNQIKEARSIRPFIHLEDFLRRTKLRQTIIENLAMANAFSVFGMDQRHSFWKSIEFSKLMSRNRESGQLSLFDESEFSTRPTDQVFNKMSLYENILEDYQQLGYSLRGNLMKGIHLENKNLPKIRSIEVKQKPHGTKIVYAGIVTVIQRPPTANGVAFITLEDDLGSLDLVVFESVFEKFRDIIKSSRFLVISGKVEKRSQSISVTVSSLKSFESEVSVKTRKPLQSGEHPRNISDFA